MLGFTLKRNIVGIQYRSAFNLMKINPFAADVSARFASTNFSDPDASKPTLNIDPFKKSQRLSRPISPHLLIYQPQLTWYLSALHRITGAGVGGLFYLTAMAYAIFPIDSSSLALAIHSYPFALLFISKAILGFPIFFHSFNGVRHLIWDTASALTLKGVYCTGYVVLVLSGLATFLFALW